MSAPPERQPASDSERCSGVTWGGGRCSLRGSWADGGKVYCKLHRPDRVAHAANRKRVRERRASALKALIEAARLGNQAALLRQAGIYREMCERFQTLMGEARTKYHLHGRFIAKAPRGCPDCSRTDAHTHCPECGSVEHGAAYCDMLG